jgi:hypothetical protein
MTGELASSVRGLRRLRVDPQVAGVDPDGPWRLPLLVVLACGFVLIGAARLDLGPDEARLGLAAGEKFGPLGRVVGTWEPSLWPAAVIPSQIWAWLEGGAAPTSSAVRWPGAIALVVAGFLITRRTAQILGPRASLLVAIGLFGSLAWLDRSSSTGIEPIGGLAVVGALDRLLNRGSDWIAGFWTALGVLAGGWPPLAMILLPVIVLGRSGATLSKGLILPPILAFVAWSVWAFRVAPAQAWGAALTLPLTRGSAWMLAPEILILGLPWSPFALGWAFRSVRTNLNLTSRTFVLGWLQVGGVGLLAGTLIPGLGTAARLPMLVALATASAAVLDRAWAGALSPSGRRTMLGVGVAVAVIAALILGPVGVYLAAAWSYYRAIGIVLTIGSLATLLLAIATAGRGSTRGMTGSVVAVALLMKIAYTCVYAPEWNYRFSQGPWGRAVGQWVPPGWTIYTTTEWPTDFAFATGRSMRRLTHPKQLEFRLGGHPEFILLLASEFEHWPEDAPRLVKVRDFESQHCDEDRICGRHVLARSEGELDLSRLADDHK